MYSPNSEKLKKYLGGSGDAQHMDWHAWVHDLSPSEEAQLASEVLAAGSRADLSEYAKQYYLDACNRAEDEKLRSIEHGFVIAQIEDRPPEEVAKIEDMYFERARDLLREREKIQHED